MKIDEDVLKVLNESDETDKLIESLAQEVIAKVPYKFVGAKWDRTHQKIGYETYILSFNLCDDYNTDIVLKYSTALPVIDRVYIDSSGSTINISNACFDSTVPLKLTAGNVEKFNQTIDKVIKYLQKEESKYLELKEHPIINLKDMLIQAFNLASDSFSYERSNDKGKCLSGYIDDGYYLSVKNKDNKTEDCSVYVDIYSSDDLSFEDSKSFKVYFKVANPFGEHSYSLEIPMTFGINGTYEIPADAHKIKELATKIRKDLIDQVSNSEYFTHLDQASHADSIEYAKGCIAAYRKGGESTLFDYMYEVMYGYDPDMKQDAKYYAKDIANDVMEEGLVSAVCKFFNVTRDELSN